MIAEVKTIYESNSTQIPEMLDILKADAVKADVKEMVTICFCDGEIDVRAFGRITMPETIALVAAAQQWLVDQQTRNYRLRTIKPC